MKKALIISIAINCLLVLFFIGKRIYYTYGNKPAPTADWREVAHKQTNGLYSTMRIDSTDIVFVGNSLTFAFPVTELFGPDCKNRGINGNTTAQILSRIQAIAECKPRKIFVEAGINDIYVGLSVDSIYTNYVSILRQIRNVSPNTCVYVQSVFPNMKEKNKSIVDLNSMIKNYCDLHGIVYIDIYSKLLAGDRLNKELTEDDTHLNGKGYQIWKEAIERYVQ